MKDLKTYISKIGVIVVLLEWYVPKIFKIPLQSLYVLHILLINPNISIIELFIFHVL